MEKVRNGCKLKCNAPLSEPCRILLGITPPSLANGALAVILLSTAGENTDCLCYCHFFLISFSLYPSVSFFLFLPCCGFPFHVSSFSYFSYTRFLNFLLLSFIFHNFILSFPLLLLGFFLIHFLISFPLYSGRYLLSICISFRFFFSYFFGSYFFYTSCFIFSFYVTIFWPTDLFIESESLKSPSSVYKTQVIFKEWCLVCSDLWSQLLILSYFVIQQHNQCKSLINIIWKV
jgi:hypothetical protein